jgi:hypothetical protein
MNTLDMIKITPNHRPRLAILETQGSGGIAWIDD